MKIFSNFHSCISEKSSTFAAEFNLCVKQFLFYGKTATDNISDNAKPEIANCNVNTSVSTIQSKIFTIRGVQVMMDRDLAELYRVETRVLNQAVKRNSKRFPERFMFQLTVNEWNSMSSQFVTTCPDKRPKSALPFVFTEQGVTQLSAVLHSDLAIEVSIRINDAFHAMRRFIASNAGLLQRMYNVERHLIETDNKIDKVLDCLEEGTLKEKAHIFSSGQVYDAKAFITELIDKAPKRVIIIDGYVNATTINLLDARAEGVTATIYTHSVGESLNELRNQYSSQYPKKPLSIEKWRTEQHDRWLIIDDELWHCGASLKDAGVKTFGIDPIGLDVNMILAQVGR